MSRKQVLHLMETNFMGVRNRIKKLRKSRAVTTANKINK